MGTELYPELTSLHNKQRNISVEARTNAIKASQMKVLSTIRETRRSRNDAVLREESDGDLTSH
jgi:hypothetical protein